MNALIKTEILSPTVWGEEAYTIELPALYLDDRIHLSFTIPTFGKIKGLFKVVDHLHVYDSSAGVPYTQRVVLEVVD